MDTPDKRLFEADLVSAEFRNGMMNGWWGVPDGATLPAATASWPRTVLWIAAAPRGDAPCQYYLSLDMSGYRAAAPTGTFFDPATGSMLELAKRPKGRPERWTAYGNASSAHCPVCLPALWLSPKCS